ncbi:MAG: hypothetical protein QOI35_3634 [Cryptosporangiaceae bacterium]|nr:hypothetical protein [Cryptosporangiaceae bacterium]MDQ1656305.1 hypothetical protein [Cryptosporangiaceae bacterium]
MAAPNIDLIAFEADDGGDFAHEHASATFADELAGEPGMEPDESTPHSLAGMD